MNVQFDIIIVSFNAGHKLAETLASVLTQEGVGDGMDYRVIVKDADSADDSVEEARRLLATYPAPIQNRVEILTGRDEGIYDAMNRALDACYGAPGHSGVRIPEEEVRLVYFINCGDTLAETDILQSVADGVRAESQRTGRDESRPLIFYGDVIECRTGERVSENPRIDDFALYRHVPCHQACFYDAALFLRERFDTSLRVRADYEHFLKSCYNYHARCVYLPVAIARYEGGGFSETAENRRLSAAEHRIVLKRYMDEEMIRRFDRRMKLTLQPVRTFLAEHKKTAGVYNGIRRTLYRFRKRET